MFAAIFYKRSVEYMKLLNNRSGSFCKRDSGNYATAFGNDNIIIEYKNRSITLGIRGAPRFLCKKAPLSNGPKDNYDRNQSFINSITSELSTADCVYVGIGSRDMSLVLKYLEQETDEDGKKRKMKAIDMKGIQKQYGQYLPVIRNAQSLGIPCINIGRNRSSELASFGNASIKNKSEVFNLLFLYLTKSDLLSDEGLSELSKMSPNIYEAIVLQSAYYIMCGIHREIFGIDNNQLVPKRRNLKLLVVVDQWLKLDLLKFIKSDLLDILNQGTSPLVAEMLKMENQSLRNWSHFLILFLIFPSAFVTIAVVYSIYRYFYKLQRDRYISITDEDCKGKNKTKFNIKSSKYFSDPSRD